MDTTRSRMCLLTPPRMAPMSSPCNRTNGSRSWTVWATLCRRPPRYWCQAVSYISNSITSLVHCRRRPWRSILVLPHQLRAHPQRGLSKTESPMSVTAALPASALAVQRTRSTKLPETMSGLGGPASRITSTQARLRVIAVCLMGYRRPCFRKLRRPRMASHRRSCIAPRQPWREGRRRHRKHQRRKRLLVERIKRIRNRISSLSTIPLPGRAVATAHRARVVTTASASAARFTATTCRIWMISLDSERWLARAWARICQMAVFRTE
jgi:hypothetical protein